MSCSKPGEMAPESSKPMVFPKFDMHIYTSELTSSELKTAVTEYNIPMDLHLHLPPPGMTLNRLSLRYIGLYIEQLKQGGLRIPFSSFFLAVIRHFGGHWFSFENKTGRGTKKCFKEVTSSLKWWKKKIFLLDRRAIPDAMPWRHGDTDLHDDFSASYNENDVARLSEFLVPLRPPPRHLLYVCGLTTSFRHPELQYNIRDQDNNVARRLVTVVEVAKDTPHLEKEVVDLSVHLPQSSHQVLIECSSQEKELVKRVKDLERDKWRTTALDQCEKLSLSAKVAQAEADRQKLVQEFIPAVVKRLHTSVKYSQSLAAQVSLCFTSRWLGGLSLGRSEDQVAQFLAGTKDLDIEGSKSREDKHRELFTKQYPYIKKVADSYLLSVADLMKISPDVPTPPPANKTEAPNADGTDDVARTSPPPSKRLLQIHPLVLLLDVTTSSLLVITEYLVNISKRRAFWSLNEDILKINDSDYQYVVSIKEDTAYPCLHSPKTTKETRSIRRIQRRPIRRIKDIVCEDFGRYQAWSLLQETPNTPALFVKVAAVPRPPDANIVRSMWLFRHKYNADGTLSRYKARLVANGSTQLAGIDVDETFSPVVKPATIRTVLSLAISRHWPVHQLDVKNAFLHRSLSETVYMHQPPGFRDPQHLDHVCLLQRSLYGLKQAPRAWFQRFSAYAARVGFHHSRCDSSLFIYRQGADTAYLLLYVDDIVLTASSSDLLQQIITSLHAEFSMTDLGSLNYFLGISVTRNASGMFLSQQKYATEVLDRAGMLNCKPCRTPVDTDSKLSADGAPISDSTLYRSLALYIIHVCLFMHDLREPHLSALKRNLTDAGLGGLSPLTRPSKNSSVIVFFLGNTSSPGQYEAAILQTLSTSAEAEYWGVANFSPNPQSQENVTQTAETVTTSNELDLLFSSMFDELLNETTPVVSKSSAVYAADAPDKPPTQVPSVTAPENIIQAETNTECAQVDDDKFINIFSTPVQERGEGDIARNRMARMCMFALTVIRTRTEEHQRKPWLILHGLKRLQKNFIQFVNRLDVWELVDRPLCKNVINLKWLWVEKQSDEENTVIRNKSRLVAKGYAQKEGIDFEDVNQQLDLLTHFIMTQALPSHESNILSKTSTKSVGMLYSTTSWYSNGFLKRFSYSTLFITKHREDILLVQIYVDDIIFGSTNLKLSKRFEKRMHCKFDMSMMRELKFFLGIQIHQSPRGIFINQAKYAQEILKSMIHLSDYLSIHRDDDILLSHHQTKLLVGLDDGVAASFQRSQIHKPHAHTQAFKVNHSAWDGETVILGDFSEVRSEHERFGTIFNIQGANAFNSFIALTCLIDLPLGGYSFTWAHKSATKMRCDFRLRPTQFCIFHSWFKMEGFEKLVQDTWKDMNIVESNGLLQLKKKLQTLKIANKAWSKEAKSSSSIIKSDIKQKLSDIDHKLDQGGHNEENISQRSTLLKDLHDVEAIEALKIAHKAKIRWSIERDKNSKYFHGIFLTPPI
ncbi:ribonuclease H-like domain-containing protein [Tanacetum coccineum]